MVTERDGFPDSAVNPDQGEKPVGEQTEGPDPPEDSGKEGPDIQRIDAGVWRGCERIPDDRVQCMVQSRDAALNAGFRRVLNRIRAERLGTWQEA